MVDLPGYVAFETAHYLALGLALRSASRDVLPGTPVVSHAYHADQVQAAIGIPVTASVESVPDHLSPGRFDGRDSAEAGERGLTVQALWVVPGHAQQRRCMVRTDTQKGSQLRGDIRHQPIQLLIELGDFFGELCW